MWWKQHSLTHQHLSDSTLLDERIRLERHHITTGAVSVTVGAAIVYALLPRSTASAWWFAFQLLLGAGWLIFFGLYNRNPDKFRDWWPRVSTLASSLRGFSWGLGWILFVGAERTDDSLLYIILYAGVIGGGLNATAFSRTAMLSFGIACNVPVIWGAFLTPDYFHVWSAVAAVIYTLILLRLTLNVNAFLMDALERREREASLAKRLELANQEKSRFFAAASHDLRQPLQAIHFFQYALDKSLKSKHDREVFTKLQEATDALTDLLNSLLDISRLDTGGIDIQKQPALAHDLLQRVYQRYLSMAVNAGITLEYVPVRVWLHTDPKQLERIIQNFVVNAIKHIGKPGGRIVLGGRRQGKALRIEVHDNGIGIPTHAQEAIFTEFYQLNNPERNRQKGLGLGLSIVRRLAVLLEHEVGVKSEQGRGSTFFINVPLTSGGKLPVIATGMDTEGGAPQLPGKALLVEDDQTVLKSLEMLFRLWDYPAITATTLNPAAILQQHRDIHLVVSDYQLQDGYTGLQLIQQLRTLSGRDIPAILITGNTSPEVLETIHAAGIGVSYKPINPRTLRHAIDRLVTTLHPPA
ncbi:ATP-binding response regulator [Thiothrix nivea]|uniref:histidine kinase n=1 Tax=Thiothrix nivea (strain ATCC 35100 / DSM 5205 / JP2) TaxID=870187 RepID=A0A656HDU5_THINJ|nr:hybrid sensor histidine kinase/response regulator [Thiothrix nivea]EIJ35068.1 integral membrane sensor hybrid histidine kinase [Thiothrix nivea DSM 5205]